MNWLLLLMAVFSSIWAISTATDNGQKLGGEIATDQGISQIDHLDPAANTTILAVTLFSGLILGENRSKWIEVPHWLPHPPYGSGAVYFNDEIYLIGGVTRPEALYKLDKNLKWVQLANMTSVHKWISNSCLAYNGYIWVFGGKNEKFEPVKSVERYDPKTDKWTRMPDMKYPRSDAAVVLWNDNIIISGGFTGNDKANSNECYNPQNGQNCTGLPDLPKLLDDHSMVYYKERLIVMGGYGSYERNTSISNEVLELDLLKTISSWKSLPAMKYAASSFAGIIVNNEIYAIGGFHNSSGLTRVEIFDGTRWRDGPPLPTDWCCGPAVIIPQQLADRLMSHGITRH